MQFINRKPELRAPVFVREGLCDRSPLNKVTAKSQGFYWVKGIWVASVRPVALGFELLGEVLHLIRQDPLFGQKMPLISVGPKWHS